MNERRERERHKVVAEAVNQLKASIQYVGEDPLRISVQDLSRWGMGFVADFEPAVAQNVTVEMHHRDVPIRFRATIKWAKQVDGRWSAGCEFADELGQDFLLDLSDARVLDPTAERETTWVRAIVRSNVAPDQKYSAEIVNYSDRGVCLATKNGFGPGESLLLEIDDNHRPRTMFVANVVWERPEDGCVLQGCTFPSAIDAKNFYKAVRRHSQSRQAAAANSHKKRGFFHRLLNRR